MATSTPAAGAPVSVEPDVAAGLRVRLPDGRRLNFRCTGAGAPTVILESGFGASSLAWFRIQSSIALKRRVCAYDRAGYGESDPGPAPRDGDAVARDLDEGLRAAGLRGPFVLVGHSAGGLYVRLFRARRPRDVVGMVLVDPSAPHQDARFSAVLGTAAPSITPLRRRAEACLNAAESGRISTQDATIGPCLPAPTIALPTAIRATRIAEAAKPATWRAQLAELDTLWGRTSDQVDAMEPKQSDTPLIVLTATEDNVNTASKSSSAASELWLRLHREIAESSTSGEVRLVKGSSHMMMNDRPDAVLDAIDDVVARAALRRPVQSRSIERRKTRQ